MSAKPKRLKNGKKIKIFTIKRLNISASKILKNPFDNFVRCVKRVERSTMAWTCCRLSHFKDLENQPKNFMTIVWTLLVSNWKKKNNSCRHHTLWNTYFIFNSGSKFWIEGWLLGKRILIWCCQFKKRNSRNSGRFVIGKWQQQMNYKK